MTYQKKRAKVLKRQSKRRAKHWSIIKKWVRANEDSAKYWDYPGIKSWAWKRGEYEIRYEELIRGKLIDINHGNRNVVGLGFQNVLSCSCADSVSKISTKALIKLLSRF